ncbi:hypothetical protein [uncultured Mucilaginibacter sp.]|uniref:hypothetical protein n=1 Tax=uncultured Mucilaginibacter sp. TaxID=797541 RepID=UPI0025E7F73C|nr:hypothetical protein [uncultured Mucilaginibacter sp.]
MKIFKTLYFCFAILFILLWIYILIYIKIISLGWLIAELAGFLLLVIAYIVHGILKGIERPRKIFLGALLMVIVFGFNGYNEIKAYKRNVCQAQFGPEFNTTRRSIGTPIIPANWQIKESSEGRVLWQPADSLIGHQKKYIRIETGCAIEEELDYYGLASRHGNKRELMIETQFGRGRLNDSVFYYYYHDKAGRRTDTLSRQQADSIFAAEKIRKDY